MASKSEDSAGRTAKDLEGVWGGEGWGRVCGGRGGGGCGGRGGGGVHRSKHKVTRPSICTTTTHR